MNIKDIKRINSLWKKVYPFLASQIMEDYQRRSGSVLELGPFSGGISVELAKICPQLHITIADESPAVLEYLRGHMTISGQSQKIKIEKTDFNNLSFEASRFDLVIFRGAFFFLTEKENLLQEIYRVLKEGGMAFIGGGFGRGVPWELIDEIADKSRELNIRLGRKWLMVKELDEIARRSKLIDNCRIVEEGGLWLYIRK